MENLHILRHLMEHGEVYTTKEISKMFQISMTKAYQLCSQAEKDGWLRKYGYKCKDGGYEDVSNSSLHLNSLTWQHCEEGFVSEFHSFAYFEKGIIKLK